MGDHPSPGSNEHTSLSLLDRLRVDDPAAWSIVVKLYTPLVHRWGARAGVQQADLDDLSQEVFRSAASGFSGFRRDRPGDSFRGWLYGITRNFLLKHFERLKRSPRATGGTDAFLRLQEIGEAAADSDDDVAHDKHAVYLQAMELMKEQFEEKTWHAFWMTVVDGLSPDDVAGRLGLTAVAVRKYKSRVLHRLRSEFGDFLE
jgi:RNA polymerase sigma-70 factor (ECF subfamily)